jgi:lysine biosynthesis protein LysW
MDNTNTVKIKCAVCENEFDLDTTGLNVGDIVECPVCGGTLEMVSMDPVTVEPIVKGK